MICIVLSMEISILWISEKRFNFKNKNLRSGKNTVPVYQKFWLCRAEILPFSAHLSSQFSTICFGSIGDKSLWLHQSGIVSFLCIDHARGTPLALLQTAERCALCSWWESYLLHYRWTMKGFLIPFRLLISSCTSVYPAMCSPGSCLPESVWLVIHLLVNIPGDLLVLQLLAYQLTWDCCMLYVSMSLRDRVNGQKQFYYPSFFWLLWYCRTRRRQQEDICKWLWQSRNQLLGRDRVISCSIQAPCLTHILLNFSQFWSVLSSQLLYDPGLDFPEPEWEQSRRKGVGQHGEVGREGQDTSGHSSWRASMESHCAAGLVAALTTSAQTILHSCLSSQIQQYRRLCSGKKIK